MLYLYCLQYAQRGDVTLQNVRSSLLICLFSICLCNIKLVWKHHRLHLVHDLLQWENQNLTETADVTAYMGLIYKSRRKNLTPRHSLKRHGTAQMCCLSYGAGLRQKSRKMQCCS